MNILLEVDVWHLELQGSFLVEREQGLAREGIVANLSLIRGN